MKVLVHYVARNLGKGLILICAEAWMYSGREMDVKSISGTPFTAEQDKSSRVLTVWKLGQESTESKHAAVCSEQKPKK